MIFKLGDVSPLRTGDAFTIDNAMASGICFGTALTASAGRGLN